MFRMLGKKVELYRYTVTYTENEEVMIENCISEDHKNEIEQMLTDKEIIFETKTIDQAENEWFNGLEFDSYDEALAVFNVGAEAGKQALYESKSQELIAQLYPPNEENKVVREYLAYPADTAKQEAFTAYNAFVETCKQQAYTEVYGS